MHNKVYIVTYRTRGVPDDEEKEAEVYAPDKDTATASMKKALGKGNVVIKTREKGRKPRSDYE